jgi:phasin
MAEDRIGGMSQMPESMRAVFETGVAQARAMFEQMMAATERAMSGFEGSARALQSNAMDVNRRIMTIAEQNVTAALGLAERLVQARDMQEMLQAHQSFVREQMERLGDQTRELTELAKSSTARMAEGTWEGPGEQQRSGGGAGLRRGREQK